MLACMLLQLCCLATFQFVFVFTNNVATNHVTYIQSPIDQPSYFGYSVAAQQNNGNFTLWIGSPKYSVPTSSTKKVNPSTAKQGAIFKCSPNLNSKAEKFKCSTVNLKPTETQKIKEESLEKDLPPMALEQCDFETDGMCGFIQDNRSDFNWEIESRSGLLNRFRFGRRRSVYCYDEYKASTTRITGPPPFTINDWYLNANSAFANLPGLPYENQKTILVSPVIQTRKGLIQCLRFCFQAHSKIITARRSLRVWLQYLNNSSSVSSTQHTLFNFSSIYQQWSLYWNHSEINIEGLYDGSYQIYFEAVVYKKNHTQRRCRAEADIALTDITVANSACKEESTDVDEIITEQSIGLNLALKTAESNVVSVASCAPLWQQNCGYAREAVGVCYQVEINGSRVENITRHNPMTEECIRGKIDIVLIVDQSGSVNHCNFQKVKRWLRNIVRGFNIGEEEQDIGVIVYSSKTKTRVVVDLGFHQSTDNELNKKVNTIEILKSLSYQGGTTYTGHALKVANDILSKARPSSKKIIILLTDGATTKENKKELEKEINRSRKQKITILAVGVGNFNEKELIQIAGTPRNFFSVRKFSELEKIRDNLRSSVSFGVLEGKGKNETSTNTQQCQMGFSVHFSQESLVMGSPGCYDLSGNVISYRSDSSYPMMENFASSRENFYRVLFNESLVWNDTAGSGSVRFTANKTTSLPQEQETSQDDYQVPSLAELQDAFTDDDLTDSYLGYDITSGLFFGAESEEYIASSAPRFKKNGTVLIYHSLTEAAARGRHYVIGQQFGEYFGAALASADLNNDGFDDLLVGAPLHTAFQPDEGRVYVYLGGYNMSQSPDFTLFGSKLSFSRFGSYIANIGDLNMDGYSDIAVSAPLEQNGIVYIFHGSKSGITEQYVQRIDPLILNPTPPSSLSKFGQTILGKVDVDLNGYPDLIIGAPGNDTLCILLTRPIVHVDAELRVEPIIDARNESCRNHSGGCFTCSVCFRYSGISLLPGIALDYQLGIDVTHEPPRFGVDASSASYVISEMFVKTANVWSCDKLVFNLKSQLRDVMTPVVLNLTFHLGDVHGHNPHNDTTLTSSGFFGSGYEMSNATSISVDYKEIHKLNENTVKMYQKVNADLEPTLNMYGKQHVEQTLYFKTYCDVIDHCKADVSVKIFLVDKQGSQVNDIVIDREKSLRLRVLVINHGPEDSYDVAVDIQFSKALYFNTMTKISQKISAAAKY